MVLLLTLTLLFGFILALLIEPIIIKISFKKGFFDKPNERKIHHSTHIPRLGGICFLPITAIVCTVMLSAGFRLEKHWIIDIFSPHQMHFLYFAVSAFVLFCFGALDDLWGVRYRTKFIGQVIAGIILCVSGMWISDLHGLFGLHHISPVLGFPITIFAIVFITNAINFIDGIDGLASSICMLALAYFTIVFYLNDNYDYAIISVALAGPVLGFMLFNLFGNPDRRTKIFMGDTGSLFLGFALCVLGVAMNRYTGGNAHYNSFVLGFAPVILPCFDVMRVVLVRRRQGRNAFIADKNHIHHKFMSLGLSQHVVLIIVDILTIVFAAMAIVMAQYINVNIVLIVLLLMWTGLNIILPNHFNDKKE